MQSLSTILPYAQIVLSLILIGLILLQRPVSDSAALGVSDNTEHQKRGSELAIFRITILVALLFVASTIVAIVI